LSLLIAVYFSANAYALLRLSALLGIKKKLFIWVAASILTASFPLAFVLEAKADHLPAHIFYIAATIWIGVVFLLFWTVLLHDVLHLLLPIPPRWGAGLIIGLVAVLSFYSFFNAHRPRVKQLYISGPVALKAVQLSDIHLGSTSPAMLRRIVDQTNALKPNMVFITGDLLDNYTRRNRRAVKMLNDIKAPIFFVTGNHETYVGLERVTEMLAETKVKLLRNEAVNYDGVQIIGVDFGWSARRLAEELDRIKLDDSQYKILLCHSPDPAPAAAKFGVNLMLSGHTHYGQIFPFNFIIGLLHEHIKGLHRVGDCWLYISPGTGYWGPPMRLGSHCEITLINMGPK